MSTNCDAPARWVFSPDVGDELVLCDNCAIEFPNRTLQPLAGGESA